MLLRRLAMKSVPLLSQKTLYSIGKFDKFLHLIQTILNKMSNEDLRSFQQKFSQNQNNKVPVKGTQPAKTSLQAQKRFTDEQTSLSSFEKGRLKRIDEILGTKTHFHQSRMFEQRIDSSHVLEISQLKKKYGQKSRGIVDAMNPNLEKFKNLSSGNKRKLVQFMTKLKTYPQGNKELTQFDYVQRQRSQEQIINKQLIKFLSQQLLYTRLALGPLQQTIKSIHSQKLLTEQEDNIINLEQYQNNFVFRNQIYFRPQHLLSMYRIDSEKYDKKLLTSMTKLDQFMVQGQGNIQQVISLDQIYQCLKKYYKDDRVNQYLSKVQNQELDYFFTNMQISPDGSSVFIVIDLLGTKKQYVGLYKKIDGIKAQKLGILEQNVIFNFKPEVAFRNNGQLYYVQRSQQGLYIQFTKAKFRNSPIQHIPQQQPNAYKKEDKQIEQQKMDMIQKYKNQRDQQILFKCKPYEQMRITGNRQAKFSTEINHIMSNNILLEINKVGQKFNNKVYLVLHKQGMPKNPSEQRINIQQVTLNNDRIRQLIQRQHTETKYNHIDDWQLDPQQLYTQCFQIFEVGYVLVRYKYIDFKSSSEYLKYGHNQKYAKYITIIPYSKSKFTQPQVPKQKIEDKSQKNQMQKLQIQKQISLVDFNCKQNSLQVIPSIQNSQIELPSEESTQLINIRTYEQQPYKLDYKKQQLLYVCPQQQFITDLKVKHSSSSNVYLLMNLSVQAVYNRNSLYIHPLRKTIQPYSIYLDGNPLQIISENIGTGQSGKIFLNVKAPLLSVGLQYTLWKKQIKQSVRPRIYTQNLTIKDHEGDQIEIKILSGENFIKKQKTKSHQSQPVILYIPSKNERLNQNLVLKLAEKGVMLVQIVKCRGIFNTNMIQLLRGSKQMYENYIQDIYQTIVFIRQNISDRVSVYAEGPSSCFATLILNVQQNSNNQLFDASVLHQGIYDLNKIPEPGQYYFGSDPKIFQKINPIEFQLYNPTVSQHKLVQQKEQHDANKIINLSNIAFTTLSTQARPESRKFINKLRCHDKIIFQTVYLKQFDSLPQKDEFNLAFLYNIMQKKLKQQYNQAVGLKLKQRQDQGAAASRLQIDKQVKKDKDKYQP